MQHLSRLADLNQLPNPPEDVQVFPFSLPRVSASFSPGQFPVCVAWSVDATPAARRRAVTVAVGADAVASAEGRDVLFVLFFGFVFIRNWLLSP